MTTLPTELILHILQYNEENSITYRHGKFMNKISKDDSRYKMLDSFRWQVFQNNIRIKRFNFIPYELRLYPEVRYYEIFFDDPYFKQLKTIKVPKIILYQIEFNQIDSLINYLKVQHQLL